MKKLASILCLALLVITGIAFAGYTKQPTRVTYIQMAVVLDNAGTVTAVNVDGFVQRKFLINDVDPTDTVSAKDEDPGKKVSFNLLAVGNTTVGGKTLNGTQGAQWLKQVVIDQWTAQGSP